MTYPVSIQNLQSNNMLEVRWCPTNKCNFSCSYCFPGSNSGTHGAPVNLEIMINHFNHIFHSYKEQLGKEKFHFVITGGEPTIWSQFGEFLQAIKKDNIYISVITNGSRTIRWWKEFGKYVDNLSFSFHISQSNIDHQIAVADELFSQGKKVTVLVLMDPVKWDECVEAISYMKENSKYKWFIEAKHITPTNTFKVSYTEEQQSFMMKELKQMPKPFWFIKNIKLLINGNIRKYRSYAILDDGNKLKATSATYLANNYTNFKNWKCSIGQEAIYVNWDGSIKGSCGELLFGLEESHNIFNKDFIKTFIPNNVKTICQRSICDCLPDTHITKSLS